MIKKLDWYILRKFFVTFLFCMMAFTVLAVAVDSSEKTDDFVKTGLSSVEILRQYYVGFVPYIWGLLYPLFVFIAVIFFTSKMALRSEVIAMIASGTSYNRWLRPYFIGGTAMALILLLANRYAIPKANEVRSDFETKYLNSTLSPSNQQTRCPNCFYKRIDSVTYVGLKYYDVNSKAANSFFLERVKKNKVVYNLRADRIEWDSTKRNWKLLNVVERTIDSMKETVVQTPQKNVALNLQPSELRNDEFLKDKLTSPELQHFIRLEEQRATEGLAPLKVEMYRRDATPFSVLLLTLIGAIIAGRKTRGGSGLHLAIGIMVASLFILSDRFSTVFAIKSSFPPALAAWVPNIIFSVVAYYLYRKAPK
ncbi:LptF/LptG family permease [Flavisolibacter ginsenosidimutans]|uniref:LptF/LptG family permease n=1 Tax=Flavisolibacter ginsenosidimutans TaxID=661481 RepID=UPI001D15B71B|nr:LptF/LptG family permease [Flavisolibacter ginsenosidimutans]